jgi:calcium-dependent protein kinase
VEDANNLYISQEYASGCDLRRFMRKNFEKLTESKLVKIMFQVMLGLSYIHEKNVVHRDIKLENVYLSNSSSFQIKLADFGYSEYGNSKKGLQGVFGTTQYLAPEMFNRAYNEKVDIWSAGVMLFILSTGKNPYTVKNQDILIEIIKTQPLSSLRSEVQDKSANFRSFLDGLLQINPNKRFSAREALRHDWINSKIKTTFDPSLLVQEVRSVNEKNLFKKVFSLLSSYLFIENCENKKINQFFQKLDRNFEGSVKKEEYEKQLKNLFDEAGARDYAQIMFDSWDLDLDGEIQYLEFSSALMHRKNVSNEKKIEMVFSFFKESQENFIVSQKLSEFLGFCSSGKYLSCLKNQKIAEKLSFDEFKELLSAD